MEHLLKFLGTEVESKHHKGMSGTINYIDHTGAIGAKCDCGEQYWHEQGAY